MIQHCAMYAAAGASLEVRTFEPEICSGKSLDRQGLKDQISWAQDHNGILLWDNLTRLVRHEKFTPGNKIPEYDFPSPEQYEIILGLGVSFAFCTEWNATGAEVREAERERGVNYSRDVRRKRAGRPRGSEGTTLRDQIRALKQQHPLWTQWDVAQVAGCALRTVKRAWRV